MEKLIKKGFKTYSKWLIIKSWSDKNMILLGIGRIIQWYGLKNICEEGINW